MLHHLLDLLFPPKCAFCKKLLARAETDLCHNCRKDAPVFRKSNFPISFVAGWTSVWYYKGTVRESLLRYKFYHNRSYAPVFGRALAMKLQTEGMDDFDVLTWVPVSPLRKWKRGYDQVELLAKAVARELGVTALPCLRKRRNNRPQSGLQDAAQRRANVVNAYRAVHADSIRGKHVLLLDDIITTGATLSECAKTLTIAGAKEVRCAAIACTPGEKQT